MQSYGVREVERLLRLPASTVRALVAAGFVTPARGARNALRFSFQDLIVLRAAQALADNDLPPRRIMRALKKLRAQLPELMPLSGLRLGVVGGEVVVGEAGTRWQAESGQYLLEFGPPQKADGPIRVVANHDAFRSALQAESEDDSEAAIRAYAEAIEADPSHLDPRINLGTLLHERGRWREAELVYRKAIDVLGGDPVLLFNLGVLLEDMDRKREALQAYDAAIRANPELADGHYNLALLYKELGKPREAIRHMAHYRKLALSGRR